MISLQTSTGKTLQLADGASVEFVINNPLFNDGDVIPGDYSLPFDLVHPNKSEQNAGALQNGDVMEATTSLYKEEANLFYDGNILRKGKITLRKFNDNASAYFLFGLGKLANEIKALKLRTVMDENIVIDSSAIAKKIFVTPGQIGASPYSLVVNNKNYEGNTLADLHNAINANTEDPRATSIYHAASTEFNSTPRIVLEIIPYTNPNDPLSKLSVRVDDDNGTYSGGYRWWVKIGSLNSYFDAFDTFFASYLTNSPATNKFRIPFVLNDEMYGEGQEKVKVNSYVNSVFFNGVATKLNRNFVSSYVGTGGDPPFTTTNQNSLQPFVKVKYVLERIAAQLAVGLEGDWLDDVDMNAMMLDNAWPLDERMPFVGNTDFVFWRRSFNLKDLVPDMDAVDFLKALQNRYNLAINFNDRTNNLRFTKRKVVAESTSFIDFDKVMGALTGPELDYLTGIKLQSDLDKDDKLATLDEIEIGDPEEAISSKASGISASFAFGWLGATGPRKAQKIKKDFSLRIFYDGGVSGSYYYQGNINATQYDERWDGANGIYQKLWRRWINQRINRKVAEGNLLLEAVDVFKVDFEKKISVDRVPFYIAKIKCKLYMDGRVSAMATLYKA
jgi:hypothetical protein